MEEIKEIIGRLGFIPVSNSDDLFSLTGDDHPELDFCILFDMSTLIGLFREYNPVDNYLSLYIL